MEKKESSAPDVALKSKESESVRGLPTFAPDARNNPENELSQFIF